MAGSVVKWSVPYGTDHKCLNWLNFYEIDWSCTSPFYKDLIMRFVDFPEVTTRSRNMRSQPDLSLNKTQAYTKTQLLTTREGNNYAIY